MKLGSPPWQVEYPDAIVSAPSRRLKMSSAERRKLKSALAKQVYELQILQKMEQEGSLIAGI